LQIAVESERAARGQHERLRGKLAFGELEGAAVAPLAVERLAGRSRRDLAFDLGV
jgi:hypothetical protein